MCLHKSGFNWTQICEANPSRWSEAESRWVFRCGLQKNKSELYEVLKVQTLIILDSSMVEHSAVNRVVVGSSPTRGVFFFLGSMVKRLRHRPFTAVTRVQIPLESFLAQQCAELKVISRMPMWLNWQSSWFVISRLSVRVRSSAYIFGPLAQLVRATGS